MSCPKSSLSPQAVPPLARRGCCSATTATKSARLPFVLVFGPSLERFKFNTGSSIGFNEPSDFVPGRHDEFREKARQTFVVMEIAATAHGHGFGDTRAGKFDETGFASTGHDKIGSGGIDHTDAFTGPSHGELRVGGQTEIDEIRRVTSLVGHASATNCSAGGSVVELQASARCNDELGRAGYAHPVRHIEHRVAGNDDFLG